MNYSCPLDELKSLYQRIFWLKKIYSLKGYTYADFKKSVEENERDFLMKKRKMNEDIKNFDVYFLDITTGRLIKTTQIKSTDDYNHYMFHLHHYIKDYEKNKKWYDERGIKQKLILMPIIVHEYVHNQGIKAISDEEFKARFKISKWDLIFNRKYSAY